MGYRENYQAWLRDFAADEQAVADLKAIEGNEKEIEDRFYRNLSFRSSRSRDETVPMSPLNTSLS